MIILTDAYYDKSKPEKNACIHEVKNKVQQPEQLHILKLIIATVEFWIG